VPAVGLHFPTVSDALLLVARYCGNCSEDSELEEDTDAGPVLRSET
jgi:hypothetical protein